MLLLCGTGNLGQYTAMRNLKRRRLGALQFPAKSLLARKIGACLTVTRVRSATAHYRTVAQKFHRPAFHVDAAHVDMSLPYGDTPGYETPAGTILIAISRQTLSNGFFTSNKVSSFYILIFHLFKVDDRLRNSF